MKKCKNCGTQFDGNCCPKCGTWAEEKVCPKCGSKLNADDLFCPKCGFSFKNENDGKKQKSFGKWIKSHLKIVIPVIIALVTVIVLACTIPACIAGKDNGTYYLIDIGGEVNKKSYYSLKSGKWTNGDGESGTYEIDGDKIIFYSEFMGESEEWANGTLKDGVLKVTDGLSKDVYISEKHEHNFGKWETEVEPSCLTEGREVRECGCGYKDIKKSPSSGHNTAYKFDDNGHWLECTVCNEKTTEPSAHTDTSCGICGYPLYYTLQPELNSYYISGSKSGITEVTIPATFNNLPVVEIRSKAFDDCKDLTCVRYQGDIAGWCNNYFGSLLLDGKGKIKLYISGREITGNLIIPDGITKISSYAFANCSSLTDITIPDSVKQIEEGAFYNCNNLIQTENQVKYIDKWIINCDSNAKQVSLRADTRGLAYSAFSSCSDLTDLTIPNGVKYISDFAFYGCSKLKNLSLPDSLTYIGYKVFEYCELLQFTEYDNALYLGNSNNPYVLLYRAKNTEIVSCNINENTKIIYESAFSSCQITSITIPLSITYIDNFAFFCCYELKDINYNGTKAQWTAIEKGEFWGRDVDGKIHFTDGEITIHG